MRLTREPRLVALDRGEEVIEGSRRAPLGEHLPEAPRAQRLPVSRNHLAQDLDPVRDEREGAAARPAPGRARDS